jgi:hypothetical protein
MEDIKKWLDSETPDYNAGVMLFAKHNKSKAVLNWLSRIGETRGISKLRYELEKIANIQPKVQTQALQKTKLAVLKQNNDALPVQRVTIDVDGKIKREDLPQEMQILYDKIVKDHKLLRGVHEAMKITRSNAKLQKLRKKLADFDDEITKGWKAINQWATTNVLPDNIDTDNDETVINEDSKLTPQQVNAFRTYISRAIAEPDKIEAKRDKIQLRITAMLLGGQYFDDSTIETLTNLGFNFSEKN